MHAAALRMRPPHLAYASRERRHARSNRRLLDFLPHVSVQLFTDLAINTGKVLHSGRCSGARMADDETMGGHRDVLKDVGATFQATRHPMY